MKSKLKKAHGIEELKSRYGLLFILPWIIGLITFFIIPLFQSIYFSFSKVTPIPGGVKTEWIGLENYVELLKRDANYTDQLKQSIGQFVYALPIILILSLILAIMLNQKFRGRVLFRALYFLPVIIATGKVMTFIFETTDESITDIGVSGGMASQMISVDDLTKVLNLSTDVAKFITDSINSIFNLIWSCGIQIVLYLSGLQSIPSSLYEASKVEGATKWEEFWFITFPMLSRITLLVGVFTMVELFVNERSQLIERAYGLMTAGKQDSSSAMIWFYFIIVSAIMGVIIFLFTKFIMKRYES